MGIAKDILMAKEDKLRRKLEGYKKHLEKEGTYNMLCPYCQNALSNEDVKKQQCIHCGYNLEWNKE